MFENCFNYRTSSSISRPEYKSIEKYVEKAVQSKKKMFVFSDTVKIYSLNKLKIWNSVKNFTTRV